MTALNITAAELSQAKTLANQGNLAEAWKILADRGDAYAYLAQYVIALHPGYAGFSILDKVRDAYPIRLRFPGG